jgi:hypothetical protein
MEDQMSESKRTNDAPEKVAPALPDGQEHFRPDELAELIAGKVHAFAFGKTVRGYLRANYTRDASAKGTSWVLDREVAQDVLDHFANARTTSEAKVVTKADVAK